MSGLLLHAGFWWGSTILVNVPIVVATLAAVAVLSPTSKDDDDTPLDPLGAVLSLIAMAGILYGIIEGQHGWTAGGVLAAFAIGGLAMVGFIAWELRAEHPMLPMEFFKVPSFSISSAVITAAFFMMFGFFFLATQYLQFVKGYSPLRAGFSTMPLGIALIIVSPPAARWPRRSAPPGDRDRLCMHRRRLRAAVAGDADHPLLAARHLLRPARCRHGIDRGGVDRAPDVVGPPVEGGRRLSRQRHDP
ncbi:MAG: hypothetical protein R2710_17960 [Acidimicrobiales bacterium]